MKGANSSLFQQEIQNGANPRTSRNLHVRPA